MKRLGILILLIWMGAIMNMTALANDIVPIQEMTQASLVAVGNNERFLRAVEKARRGEDVVIAYLGGSITEGYQATPIQTACFAYRSARAFADRYAADPDRVRCLNAGIAGTPSALGLLRADRDILSHAPDIVFVEFAVNDANDQISQEIYESLLRRLLTNDSEPAVILLFTVTNTGYTAQPGMQTIGAYYDLGMISVKDALFPQIEAGVMRYADYSADYAHPTTEAHGWIAEWIAHYFDKATAKDADAPYTVPDTPLTGARYEHIENMRPDSDALIFSGDFWRTRVNAYTYSEGWAHIARDGNAPLTFRANFRSLFIAFQQVNKTTRGALEVYIDGKKAETLNGYMKDAWGGIVTRILNAPEGEHEVLLKMAPGDENKAFILIDIGYVS